MSLTVNKTQMKPLLGALAMPIQLGEAASAGHVMYPNASSVYLKADADAANKWRGICLLMNAGVGDGNFSGDFANGDTVAGVFFGPVAGITGMDPTKSVWVDIATGGLTQTKPSGGGIFANPIGYPISDVILMVSPQPFDTTY